MSGGTPEQVIGNAFTLVTRLKRLGITVHNRPQAVGSAIVATLRDAGYEVVGRGDMESLRRWKAEATTVLAEWEQVWEALGHPGFLGESKAAASLRHIARGNGRSEA